MRAQGPLAGAPGSPLPSSGDRPAGSRTSGIEPIDAGSSPAMRSLGLREGTVIGGTYRIERALGAGGMGVVALAFDERLGRHVAIKLIRPELMGDPELRALLQQEARAMARVRHPNVVAVHAFGEHEGVPYFVMELVEGRTVEAWLAAHLAAGRLPDVEDVVHVMTEACRGVEAIHAAGTVHRDLKPSNLLMEERPSAEPDEPWPRRVAVSDLGVARALAEAEAAGARQRIVGSPHYLAPEAALGEDGSPSLAQSRDVYALGCIAFELFTGRPPFDGPNEMAVISRHMLEAAPPLSEARPDLAAAYAAVVERALAKSPLRRWASAAELGRALERAHAHAGDPARLLVADHDEDWRALLLRALGRRFPDADIDAVADADEAVEHFDRAPYAVVVMDFELPLEGGAGLTARLRARASATRTPLIVLSAVAKCGEWRRLARLGADGLLAKPVDPEDLVAVIRQTLRARRSAGAPAAETGA